MGVAGAGAPAEAGGGWTCRFCGTANAGSAPGCRSCKAVREAAATGGSGAAEPALPAPVEAARPGRRRRLLVVVGVMASLLGGAAGWLAAHRGAEAVTVAGFEWERAVEVEDRNIVREESWEDEVPAGARIVARRREVRHTERQPAGARKGEAVYRERPVYGQRVAYDVERWRVVRTLRAAGKDQSPRWPDIRLNLGEREGKRSESYVVLLQGRRLYRMRVPRERWQEMHEGQIGSAVVDAGGMVRELR